MTLSPPPKPQSKPTDNTTIQVSWFTLVGVAAAITHFVMLTLCVEWLALSYALSNLIGFLVAFQVSFLGHYYLTFKKNQTNQYAIDDKQVEKQAIYQHLFKWFISAAMGFLANQGLFLLALRYINHHWYWLIWLVVTGIVTVMSFLLAKFWAFR